MRANLSWEWAVALVLLAGLGCGRGDGSMAAGKNLLLITVDTTRADHLSCLGGPADLTPSLDALAARSALFTNATSETNVTNPSHLTIMTGLRAMEHGIVNNVRVVPKDLDTLSLAMQRAGYRTGGFVAAPHLAEDFKWPGFDQLPAAGEVLDAHLITDRAVGFLDAADERPFFLWAHYFDAHTLYEPPRSIAKHFYSGDPTAGDDPPIASSEWFQGPDREAVANWLGETRDLSYPRAMYAAEVKFMDREIGRLLRELEERGLTEDTVVLVVADHGESLDEHEIYYSHSGLYEPQLRIPFIVHVPGIVPGRYEHPVSTLDVTPTLAEVLAAPLTHAMSGRSLVPILRQEAENDWEDRSLIHQNAHNKGVAARVEGWKLLWPIAEADGSFPPAPQLFHLDQDPGETNDLASDHPDRMATMQSFLEPWIQQGVLRPDQEPSHLSEEDLERLRALGYVN